MLRLIYGVGAMMLALTLAACGGGGGAARGAGNSGPNTIMIGTPNSVELVFEPTSVTAPANTQIQVVFTNNSTMLPHNLVFNEGGISAATSVNVAPGDSETLIFTTPGPGSYKFVCSIHPGMEGTLNVQ